VTKKSLDRKHYYMQLHAFIDSQSHSKNFCAFWKPSKKYVNFCAHVTVHYWVHVQEDAIYAINANATKIVHEANSDCKLYERH